MIKQLLTNPELWRIGVELPQNPLRNLNVYVLKSNGKVLIIDTGFNRPECRDSLWQGINELGLDMKNVTLFLTHLHSDHIGLVWDFIERDVPVYMSRTDHEYICGRLAHNTWIETEELFVSEGFPPEELADQLTGNQGRRYAPDKAFPVTGLDDGDKLTIGDIQCSFILVPGHTPGNMVMYLPQYKILFSGDHILFDITPNISVWPHFDDALDNYLKSLEKIRGLDVKMTFPAHRTDEGTLQDRIAELEKHHQARIAETLKAITEHPGLNAFQLAGYISWKAHGKEFSNFPPHHKWFAHGETIAHLQYLTNKGQIERYISNGIYHYRIIN